MSIKTPQHKATIIEQAVDGHHATLLLQIDPEIAYFEGHFDNYPILAGVVQLDWAIYYGQQLLSSYPVFKGMEVIKFQQPILPSSRILLTLNWDEEKGKLYFSYTSGDENNHSSGRVKLGIA